MIRFGHETINSVETEKRHQYLYVYENGYGASVVRSEMSYGSEKGLWELAVIKDFDNSGPSFIIDYDNSIAHKPIGYLSEEDVEKLLDRIKALPSV